MSISAGAVHRDVDREEIRQLGRVIDVDPLDPVIRCQVGKGEMGNLGVSVPSLCSVLKGVPQEIAIQAFTGKWDVESGPRLDGVRAGNLGVVMEDVWDSLAEDFADVSEV